MSIVLLAIGLLLVLLIILIRTGPSGHLFADAQFLNVDLAGLFLKGAPFEDLRKEFLRKIREKHELLIYSFRNLLSEFKNSPVFPRLTSESQESLEGAITVSNAFLGGEYTNIESPDYLYLDAKIDLSRCTPEERATWKSFRSKIDSWDKEALTMTGIYKRWSRA